jgi:nucleoside phosphorylase
MKKRRIPPILAQKDYSAASHFKPESLLREGRRQRGRAAGALPEICILDPDGDATRHLVQRGVAKRNPHWACYHTDLFEFSIGARKFGIVPCAVGASFAVLVAEELFASGCRLVISVTSSGQIDPKLKPPCILLIEKALRDEGTSYHYLPPSEYARLDRSLQRRLRPLLEQKTIPVSLGTAWTTDAPFRETGMAIRHARRSAIHAVEMEASALYAFAKARKKSLICFAMVTNQMGAIEGDFEKGANDGSDSFLALIQATCGALDTLSYRGNE